jgi:hypothetical protein
MCLFSFDAHDLQVCIFDGVIEFLCIPFSSLEFFCPKILFFL